MKDVKHITEGFRNTEIARIAGWCYERQDGLDTAIAVCVHANADFERQARIDFVHTIEKRR